MRRLLRAIDHAGVRMTVSSIRLFAGRHAARKAHYDLTRDRRR